MRNITSFVLRFDFVTAVLAHVEFFIAEEIYSYFLYVSKINHP